MNKYKTVFYQSPSGESPVKDFLLTLTDIQQEKLIRILKYIEEYGLESVARHVRKLQGSLLWEIRILGKDNIRVLYIIPTLQIVLLLHGFIKKSQKTPIQDILTGEKRLVDWKSRH